jgi:Co/Zn/Cd efflux system component
VLGGHTSAVFLMGVVAYIGIELIPRLLTPSATRFDEAVPVAILSLAVYEELVRVAVELLQVTFR